MSDPVFTYDRINRWIEYQRVFSNLLTQSKTLDSQKYFPNQLNIKYLMEPNQFITAYSKLQNLVSSNNSSVLIPPLGFDYPRSDTELLNIMYGQQERDFTRELVNSFNNFAFWVERIRLWEKILLDYSENEIFHLRHEFTKLPIDFCVSFPYLFKSRLTFCATKLCCIKAHTKNLITLDEIVKDDKIDINFFEKISKHWSSGSALVDCLRTANSHQYIDATSNYRNKSQHRHPQHLDVGQTLNFVVGMGIKLPSSDPDPFSEEMMKLSEEMMKQNIASLGEDDEIDVDDEIDTDIDKCVIYSFETSKPLSTETILPLLEDESKHLRAAFMAYRSLVDEQTNS